MNSCSDGAHAFYANFHRRIWRLRSKWLWLRTASRSSRRSGLVGPVKKVEENLDRRLHFVEEKEKKQNKQNNPVDASFFLDTGRWKRGWSENAEKMCFLNKQLRRW